MACECTKVGSNCTDFCSCGDDYENQLSEAPEPIGVVSSSDPDDLTDVSCDDESDVDIQLED